MGQCGVSAPIEDEVLESRGSARSHTPADNITTDALNENTLIDTENNNGDKKPPEYLEDDLENNNSEAVDNEPTEDTENDNNSDAKNEPKEETDNSNKNNEPSSKVKPSPEWLTKPILEKALRSHKNDSNLQITDCKVEGALANGENYMSVISRASCTVKESNGNEYTDSMIIKTLPMSAILKTAPAETFFLREIKMLEEVMPTLEEILGKTHKLAAELYYAEMEPKPIIVMEDLCPKGWKVGDRLSGLPLDESLVALKTLAMYHVASMVLLERREDLRNFFSTATWGAEGRGFTYGLFSNGFIKTTRYISSWSDNSWSEELAPLTASLIDQFYEAYDSKEGPQVIIHGDPWTNNIMFKTDENKLEACFVDLQISSVRAAIVDVVYFVFTGPANEIRIKEIDAFLSAYFEQWCQTCKDLKVANELTFESLKEAFRKNLIIGLGFFLSLFVAMSAPAEDIGEVSEKVGNYVGDKIFDNKYIQEAILEALPYFKENGVFSREP